QPQGGQARWSGLVFSDRRRAFRLGEEGRRDPETEPRGGCEVAVRVFTPAPPTTHHKDAAAQRREEKRVCVSRDLVTHDPSPHTLFSVPWRRWGSMRTRTMFELRRMGRDAKRFPHVKLRQVTSEGL